MRKWLIKQMEKFGLDSSNLKSKAELNGRILEYGESEKIQFPIELNEDQMWTVKKWNFNTGQIVEPGDIIGIIESEKQRWEFESYVGGKLEYTYPIGKTLVNGTVLAEIKGIK